MSAAPAPTETCAEGSIVAGKYRLESLLGQGGMGSVWRAINVQLEVPVAVKLLRTDLAATDLGERLRVEARAAAKLVHPGIVRVFDIGESDAGDPFIVMELLSGESLGSMLERGPVPAETALQLLLPIAEGLSLAHSRGVVHRDLKPDNIFIAREGGLVQPKLLDFGIAKVTSGRTSGVPSITQTGTLLGSPDYMSPEQAYARSDVDERSDIWAFCVVLYEMLTGHPPFCGESAGAVLRSVVQDEPPPLEGNVDPALSAILMRGLAKDRDARPASIFDLGRELAQWLFTHGVLEDVTGASLEAKWLGRSESSSGSSPSGFVARAQHEHATLVSVVHPSPLLSHDPLVLTPPLRRRRWLPVTLVASVTAAAAIAAGWAMVTPVSSGGPVAAAALPSPDTALTQSETRAASQLEPAPVRLVNARSEIAPAEAQPKAKAKAAPKVVTNVSAPARNPSAERAPAALSLPRALPADPPPPPLKKRSDLMNPY